MEPQVWVPWVIAGLAPLAVLASQWLSSRDRAADRAQALQSEERAARRALADHWRDERFKAHARYHFATLRLSMLVLDALEGTTDLAGLTEAPAQILSLNEKLSTVSLLAGEDARAAALDLATALEPCVNAAVEWLSERDPAKRDELERTYQAAMAAHDVYELAARADLLVVWRTNGYLLGS